MAVNLFCYVFIKQQFRKWSKAI